MIDPHEHDPPLTDAEKQELEAFSMQFRRSAPMLPEDAIDRVGSRTRSALARRSWLRKQWQLVAAASLLVGTALTLLFFAEKEPRQPPRQFVFDTITLPYHPTPAPSPSSALIPLDEYRTLFSD